MFEAALESGAEDVQSTEEGHEIWTAVDSLHEVAKALEQALGEAEGTKLAWRPQTVVSVGEGDAGQLLKLIDALDDDDDVQTVWGNYDVPDEVMEKLGKMVHTSLQGRGLGVGNETVCTCQLRPPEAQRPDPRPERGSVGTEG